MLTDADREFYQNIAQNGSVPDVYGRLEYAVLPAVKLLLQLDVELRELQPIISDAIGDLPLLTSVERRTARECMKIVEEEDEKSYDKIDSYRIVLAGAVTDAIARRFLPEEVVEQGAPQESFR